MVLAEDVALRVFKARVELVDLQVLRVLKEGKACKALRAHVEL
jgi:hypothetical protein